MPFAHNGLISQSPIEGGTEITEAQYADALAGMLAGKVVTIDNGFAVMDPPEQEPEPAPEPEPPTHDQQILAIKAEARRRIIAIMDEDKQRNTLAAGLEATMTYGADPANWPPELQARQSVAMTAWAEIERLRTRSDEIELMEPLPDDITDDGLWVAAD